MLFLHSKKHGVTFHMLFKLIHKTFQILLGWKKSCFLNRLSLDQVRFLCMLLGKSTVVGGASHLSWIICCVCQCKDAFLSTKDSKPYHFSSLLSFHWTQCFCSEKGKPFQIHSWHRDTNTSFNTLAGFFWTHHHGNTFLGRLHWCSLTPALFVESPCLTCQSQLLACRLWSQWPELSPQSGWGHMHRVPAVSCLSLGHCNDAC